MNQYRLIYRLDTFSNNNALPPCMSCYSFKRITQDGKIEDLAQVISELLISMVFVSHC